MRGVWWLLVGLFLMPIAASSQNPVTWSMSSSATTVAPGAKLTAKVTAKIESGWHIYSITQGPGGPVPTEITVPPKQPFILSGFVIGPLPHSNYDENFQMQTESYSTSAVFKVPLIVDKKASGPNTLSIDVRFEVCNERQCLPAKTIHLTTPVKIAEPGAKIAKKL